MKKLLLYFVMFALMFPAAYAQETDDSKDSPVITQGIDAAKVGVEYWTAEKVKSNVYCVPETKDICLSMETRCDNQLKAWTTELENQVRIGSQYVVHSSSYWAAKRYLNWAYKAREALEALYKNAFNETIRKTIGLILDGLNKAIATAEKIIELLN